MRISALILFRPAVGDNDDDWLVSAVGMPSWCRTGAAPAKARGPLPREVFVAVVRLRRSLSSRTATKTSTEAAPATPHGVGQLHSRTVREVGGGGRVEQLQVGPVSHHKGTHCEGTRSKRTAG